MEWDGMGGEGGFTVLDTSTFSFFMVYKHKKKNIKNFPHNKSLFFSGIAISGGQCCLFMGFFQ